MPQRLLAWYSSRLSTHPYLAQMGTAGALWFTGDQLSQYLESRADPRRTPATTSTSTETATPETTTSTTTRTKPKQDTRTIDWKRSAIMTGFGVLCAGPAYAAWYSFLDRRLTERMFVNKIKHTTPATASQITPHLLKWKITLAKVVADSFLFDPPFLGSFFFATHMLNGHGVAQTWEKMKRDVPPTYLVDLQVWTPIQLFNFRFVPVPWQPVVVNMGNVGWNAYLSYVQHLE